MMVKCVCCGKTTTNHVFISTVVVVTVAIFYNGLCMCYLFSMFLNDLIFSLSEQEHLPNPRYLKARPDEARGLVGFFRLVWIGLISVFDSEFHKRECAEYGEMQKK